MQLQNPKPGFKPVLPIVSAVLVALALSACADKYDYIGKPKDIPNVFPATYKKEITDLLTTTLEDPTNVRDAYITDPVLTKVNKDDERYTVCVRSNSRNAARQYKGSEDRIAYFYGGHLNQLIAATKEQCGNAPYKPFPELEKLCLGKSCE
ncbi:MAG: hypothetical protein GC182_19050 [Rhodopseudomonas sp.]|nr:hypothetical protein [Rhodopseudomonas sp.]